MSGANGAGTKQKKKARAQAGAGADAPAKRKAERPAGAADLSPEKFAKNKAPARPGTSGKNFHPRAQGLPNAADLADEHERQLAEDLKGCVASNFRVPSRDQNGHHERTWAFVTPRVHQAIIELSTSGRWPYRTPGDFIRHAIMRHFDFLARFGPLPSVMQGHDALMALAKAADYSADVEEGIRRAPAIIEAHVREGRLSIARRLMNDFEREIRRIPDDGGQDGEWRNHYLNRLEQCFAGTRRLLEQELGRKGK